MDKIFDTHAHYDDEAFDSDREELLSRFQKAGIAKVVNIGADLRSTESSIELAQQYPFIYAAAGVHPSDAGQLSEETFAWLAEQAKRPKVVAIGEIGLDYYWEKDPEKRENQRYWFRRQIGLAREMGLPIVIHSREAAQDTMDIAKDEKLSEVGGIVHCYAYSVEHAREYIKMGLFLGIGGVVTYKNSRVLKEVVQAVPLDSIVLETDSPYLSPVPNRGKRNSSLNLSYVIDQIAALKNVSREEVIQKTWENAHRAYRMEG
ncbi:MAG: TatD family hydrolase [Lachnospiraceae bacterium]|nr:TatD family hydrolase [Lachnospiraceae bacterium]